MKKYSPSTRGFYDQKIHSAIPEDAVSITDAEWRALRAGQCAGKEIRPGSNGKPELFEAVQKTGAELLKQQILELEVSITPRRLRESVLGIDNGWLAAVETKIAELRAGL